MPQLHTVFFLCVITFAVQWLHLLPDREGERNRERNNFQICSVTVDAHEHKSSGMHITSEVGGGFSVGLI